MPVAPSAHRYETYIPHDSAGNPAQPTLNAVVDVASAGDNVIVPAVAGQSIYVCGYVLVCANTNSTPRWKDGASTALSGAFPFAANGGAAPSVQPPAYWFKTSPGNALVLNLAAATQVSGHAAYWIGPP